MADRHCDRLSHMLRDSLSLPGNSCRSSHPFSHSFHIEHFARRLAGLCSRRQEPTPYQLDEHLLVTIAVVAASFMGDFAEAAAVTLFFGVGELFEHYAVGRSRKSIAALSEIGRIPPIFCCRTAPRSKFPRKRWK